MTTPTTRKHSPLPFQINEEHRTLEDGEENYMTGQLDIHDLEFITRACNSHYQLIEACQAILNHQRGLGLYDESDIGFDGNHYDKMSHELLNIIHLIDKTLTSAKGDCS